MSVDIKGRLVDYWGIGGELSQVDANASCAVEENAAVFGDPKVPVEEVDRASIEEACERCDLVVECIFRRKPNAVLHRDK